MHTTMRRYDRDRAGWTIGTVRGWVGRPLLLLAACAPWVATTVAPTVLAADAVVAQDDASAEEKATPEGKSYLVFLAEALGIKYITIFLLLSFGLVSLLVKCFLQVRQTAIMPPALLHQLEGHRDDVGAGSALLGGECSTLARVLGAGMRALPSGQATALEAMRITLADEQQRLGSAVGRVGLLGKLALLVGFYGFVDGLMCAFMRIAASDTCPTPCELAFGISQALVTAIVSLWLAIPALLCSHVLRNRLQRHLTAVAQESLRLISGAIRKQGQA